MQKISDTQIYSQQIRHCTVRLAQTVSKFLLILYRLRVRIGARKQEIRRKQQYGDDFISITDEDGKEYELEVLAELEHEGSRYLALVPAGSGDDEAEDLEVSILKSVEENGEEFLEAIEDDAELEAVYSALMDLIYEDEDEPEA